MRKLVIRVLAKSAMRCMLRDQVNGCAGQGYPRPTSRYEMCADLPFSRVGPERQAPDRLSLGSKGKDPGQDDSDPSLQTPFDLRICGSAVASGLQVKKAGESIVVKPLPFLGKALLSLPQQP